MQKRWETIDEMPLSAQLVYQILQTGERLNAGDLENRTQYSPRMVRYALRYLIDASLITQLVDINDARRRFYILNS
ncbi:MAG: ArsR family transcriptional regulator [Candidatus Hodarchaeota archaeon]